MLRLPPPLDEFPAVGFVAGNAIPALENLLAGVVVPGRRIRVVDPPPIGVVARPGRVGSIALPEFDALTRLRRNGGLSNGRENGEDGNEADEGEEREERDFLCLVWELREVSRGHAALTRAHDSLTPILYELCFFFLFFFL